MNLLTTQFAYQLEFARAETLKVVAALPEDRRLYQLRPGKATPLWMLGHLGNTINTMILRWMLNQESLYSREIAPLFAPDFAGGTPPSPDPALYPAWDEVVALYDRAMAQAAEGVRALPDDDLPNPVRRNMPEPLLALFPHRAGALTRLISHDAYHRGQMGMLAKL